MTFTVTTTAANASHLIDYLHRSFSEIAPLRIPARYFIAGSAYGVTLMVCNFLGTCGQVTKTLVVTAYVEAPVLVMNNVVATRVVNRSAALVIKADAYVSQCDGTTKTRTNMQFTWRISDNSGNILDISSSSSDPRTFWLRPYSLMAGSSYEVRLEAIYTQSLRVARTTVFVRVARGEVVAVIADSLQRLLHLNSTVIIDASSSYDQDNKAWRPACLSLSQSCRCLLSFSHPVR